MEVVKVCNAFFTENDLKTRFLLLLLPKVAPEYATMNIQEKWDGLKLK